jgi:hypothetical protein
VRLYVLLTGTFFALGAIAQLTRALLALPVRVADFDVPIWCSAVASIAAAAIALWAFRLARANTA